MGGGRRLGVVVGAGELGCPSITRWVVQWVGVRGMWRLISAGGIKSVLGRNKCCGVGCGVVGCGEIMLSSVLLQVA